MGCFNFTCAVSGLPIGAGDKVRYLLLTESPYNSRHGSGMMDFWFPRGFPLRAKYNDYGSVEDVESGPVRDLWLEAFQKDLVEKGWGDNSCHDVPTSKSMSFDELLKALWETRVSVQSRREYKPNPAATAAWVPPKEVPTLQNIRAFFAEKNLPVHTDGGGDGYMIDEVMPGVVRIRQGGYGQDKEGKLETLRPLLSDYATVIVAGSGNYANAADLLVLVKPNDKHVQSGFGEKETTRKELAVAQTMIREDVWQELLKFELRSYAYDSKTGKGHYVSSGLDRYKADAKNFTAGVIASIRESQTRTKDLKDLLNFTQLYDYSDEGIESFLYRKSDHGDPRESVTAAWLSRDTVPFTNGLSTSFRLMLMKFIDGKISQEQFDSFIDDAAEFILIHDVLMELRFWWKPSYSIGGQQGDFREHQKFNQALADLAAKIMAEQDAS